VVLQPPQHPEDVDRARPEILVQAEDQLIRPVPIDRERLAPTVAAPIRVAPPSPRPALSTQIITSLAGVLLSQMS
jgi:hypothetical protein